MLRRGETLITAMMAMSLWAGCGARSALETCDVARTDVGCDDGDGVGGGGCPATCSRPVVKIAVGRDHNCALLDDGRLKCWGFDNHGQLGIGDDQNRGDQPGEMGHDLPAVDLGSQVTIEAFGAGEQHSCALLSDGRVKCWGYNGHGQLGLGDTDDRGDQPGEMGDDLPAVDLGTGKFAVALAVHGFHSCALLNDGALKCWGANDNGQLGLGDLNDRGDQPGEMGDDLPAVDLGTGRSAVAVGLGHWHSCALLDDGSVKCWGVNGEGQLGQGDTASRGDDPGEMGDSLPAIDLGTGKTAISIHAGTAHVCARLKDGGLKCWGGNSQGQLGLGTTDARGDEPGEMGDSLPEVDLGTGETAVAVYPTWLDTCALLQGGKVKCWGQNEHGELGLGDTANRGDQPGEMGGGLPAVDLGTAITAAAISTHHHHTCAILNEGRVKCWGWDYYGQLGLGDTENRGDDPGEMGDDLPLVAP